MIGKLVVLAGAAAGIAAYKKNDNFKEKVDAIGSAVKDLGKTTVEEVKKEVVKKKEERTSSVTKCEDENSSEVEKAD
ncbi:MAG: hypothetical protein Q4B60_00065 [Erysipelotrichaceae bacterium]|nr:hypothetical protein [Erysipelotrichaceae bacterium]